MDAALPRGPKPSFRGQVAPPAGISIGPSRLPTAAIFLRGQSQSRHEIVVGANPKRPVAVVGVLCDPDLVIKELLATGLFAIEGDNNHVLVMEEFETEEQAREFLGSEYLREAMGRAGVNDEPDILVVELLEEG